MVAAVAVSGVLLKVALLLGGSSVSTHIFFILKGVAGVSTSSPVCRNIELWVIRV